MNYCNNLDEKTIILVEGKRDIEALVAIGVFLPKGQILARKGLDLNTLVDYVFPFQRIILLFDFDREGKYLRKSFKQELQHRKGHASIDSFPRQLLYKFFRAARINEIEELKQFIDIIRDKV